MAKFSAYTQGQINTATRVGMLRAADRVIKLVRDELIPSAQPRAPIWRRDYIDGWRIVDNKDSVWVVNTVPHAVFIEKGVQGSNVPKGGPIIEALAEWAAEKGIPASPWAILKGLQKRGIFMESGIASGFGNGSGMRIKMQAQIRAYKIVRDEIAAALTSAFGSRK